MELIIGGAYQGKTGYAIKKYSLRETDIFTCAEAPEIDFSARCVDNAERFALWCARNGADAAAFFEAHGEEWENSVIICEDISSGVVPLGADMRAWREQNGKLCAFLSARAQTVTRMFCGLPQRLK
ncbi:MAG: bifunctional adenosylcobinamide kinase/adenosylcobinamide-phosphate guanylyltransferase [Clostridia bacterium]|nr:bifunctional adenosylcobinamide kinase/adenosylcobinamide-phosphate guanylyltransferase [Clostridia bacterium]